MRQRKEVLRVKLDYPVEMPSGRLEEIVLYRPLGDTITAIADAEGNGDRLRAMLLGCTEIDWRFLGELDGEDFQIVSSAASQICTQQMERSAARGKAMGLKTETIDLDSAQRARTSDLEAESANERLAAD